MNTGTFNIKINSDASIFEESNSYIHAFVVRDHKGELIEARSRCLRGQVNPHLAEVIGMRESLSWVKDKGYRDAIIESDCSQVVEVIHSSISCFSYLGRVVQDCRKLLASLSDKNVSFRFVMRSANKLTHYLARYNYSNVHRIWRIGDVDHKFYQCI